MKIILLLYIFTYTFCSTEIYNITFSEGVEINKFPYSLKSLFCNRNTAFSFRLKIEDLNNEFYIKFKLKKTNNIIFKEVKAYGFTSYPSDEELTNDISNPLVNVLKSQFSHDTNYEYYTYAFRATKNIEYASISLYIKNNEDCEYIGISAYSKQN